MVPLGARGFLDINMLVWGSNASKVTQTNPTGVGVADIVKALVHHVGIATVGVRVPAAATKKGHWEDPCTEGAPIVQRR